MKNDIALIILERPWGHHISPNNRASVLPFFQGLQQLRGDFDLYHSQFYNKASFELALAEMLEAEYEEYYVYIACHGKGRKLENMHLTSALSAINQQAKVRNIVGVVTGACLVGENITHFEVFSESSSIVWQFGYKCSVNWLDGTLIDLKVFDTLMGLTEPHLYDRGEVVALFQHALSDFRPDTYVGSSKNKKPMPLRDSLTLIVQPKGQGHKAKDNSNELFDAKG